MDELECKTKLMEIAAQLHLRMQDYLPDSVVNTAMQWYDRIADSNKTPATVEADTRPILHAKKK